MHPPISQATVSLIDPEHPITREVSSMSLYDELYSYLEVSPEMKVLISHEYEGRKHPLVWACEQDGARCVYDAFGHDVQSYASADRCMLIRREVKWLLGPELPDSELLQPTNGW
jgi:type 1 glutamine amidotransferase